jgi:hypothetical protein
MLNQMNVLDRSGHTSVKWNPDNDDEVQVARITFEELTKKGYRAFTVGRFGRQGDRLDTFDPEAGEIMMVPQLKGG